MTKVLDGASITTNLPSALMILFMYLSSEEKFGLSMPGPLVHTT